MKETATGIATIGLSGGNMVEKKYQNILQIFDPEHGQTTIFVRKEGKEIVVCRVHEETAHFIRDEPITPAKLEELEKESRIYLGEGTEEEIAEMNDQIEETFIGGPENHFPEQTKIPDIMFG